MDGLAIIQCDHSKHPVIEFFYNTPIPKAVVFLCLYFYWVFYNTNAPFLVKLVGESVIDPFNPHQWAKFKILSVNRLRCRSVTYTS